MPMINVLLPVLFVVIMAGPHPGLQVAVGPQRRLASPQDGRSLRAQLVGTFRSPRTRVPRTRCHVTRGYSALSSRASPPRSSPASCRSLQRAASSHGSRSDAFRTYSEIVMQVDAEGRFNVPRRDGGHQLPAVWCWRLTAERLRCLPDMITAPSRQGWVSRARAVV